MHYRKSELYQSKILGIVTVTPKVVHISILIIIFLFSKACILNWNLGKKSWRDAIIALPYTNKPPLLREISLL